MVICAFTKAMKRIQVGGVILGSDSLLNQYMLDHHTSTWNS
jgi:hypothetical protein